MKALAIVTLLVAALFAVSACGDSRQCLRSHTEMRWVPIVQYNPATKMTDTHLMFLPESVCDEYAPKPTASP